MLERTVNPGKVVFSVHAQEQMLRRGIPWPSAMAVMIHGKERRGRRGAVVLEAFGLAIVLDYTGTTVITAYALSVEPTNTSHQRKGKRPRRKEIKSEWFAGRRKRVNDRQCRVWMKQAGMEV